MHKIEKLIDLSVWTGRWPFLNLRYNDLAALKEKLLGLNIKKAFAAPIDGILEKDPSRANGELYEKTALYEDFFSPVPIIDLSFKNWRGNMERAVGSSCVKIIKLLPNYHMYKLTKELAGELVKYTSPAGIAVSIQMRMEDKRGMHPLFKVPEIRAFDLLDAISAFPEQVFILSNIYYGEIQEAYNSTGNIYFETCGTEYQDVIELLHGRFSLDRFVFSSHAPFYYAEANVNKIKYSSLDTDILKKVMYENAERILGL